MALFDKFKNIFNNPQSIYQADGRLKNKDTVKLDTLEEIQNIPIPKYERLDGIQLLLIILNMFYIEKLLSTRKTVE